MAIHEQFASLLFALILLGCVIGVGLAKSHITYFLVSLWPLQSISERIRSRYLLSEEHVFIKDERRCV